MTKLIYPYNAASESAALLARSMGINRIKLTGSRYKPRRGDVIINWGAGSGPDYLASAGFYRVLNKPSAVRVSANKLNFFRAIDEHNDDVGPENNQALKINIPPYTTDKAAAQAWNCMVVARTTVTGSGGAGTTVHAGGQPLPNALMYTKYIPKLYEFRVHVVNGEAIDMTRKIRNPEREPTDWHIRSHDNGFIFSRDSLAGIQQPILNQAKAQAILAVAAVGLDFGGVDVVYNGHQNKCFVLEVNTAPGIEGQTVERYAEAMGRVVYG